MSCRGVTLQTRAASAAESRRRDRTSPSLAIRIRASASRLSASGTAPLRFPGLTRNRASECADVPRGVGHMSTTETDVPPARTALARELASRLQGLAVRDLDRHVVARRLSAVPLRPHAQDLDADGLPDLALADGVDD